MEFPVRCFTCGSVIGHMHEEYKSMLKDKKPGEALDILGVERICCRRMFMSHVELMDNVIKYPRV